MPQSVKETGIARWMRRHIKRGGVMVDVGANVGAYAEYASNIVGPTGRVVAFEPAPENAQRLRERCGHLEQLTVVEAAVSDQEGSVEFFLDRKRPEQHSLEVSNVVGQEGDRISVRAETLDRYLTDLARLDVLKIDAQGADLRVLRWNVAHPQQT